MLPANAGAHFNRACYDLISLVFAAFAPLSGCSRGKRKDAAGSAGAPVAFTQFGSVRFLYQSSVTLSRLFS
jgi:hypothetical protein